MKVAHVNRQLNDSLPASYGECIELANQLEQQGELDQAIKAYLKCIKFKPTDEYAFDRLMILYRKEKEYKKELAVIAQAIAAFEKLYKEAKKIPTKSIQRISNAILKSTGLSDKKGKTVFRPQPILRWEKRAALLKKRINLK